MNESQMVDPKRVCTRDMEARVSRAVGRGWVSRTRIRRVEDAAYKLRPQLAMPLLFLPQTFLFAKF